MPYYSNGRNIQYVPDFTAADAVSNLADTLSAKHKEASRLDEESAKAIIEVAKAQKWSPAQYRDAMSRVDQRIQRYLPPALEETNAEKASGKLDAILANQDPTKPMNIDPLWAGAVNDKLAGAAPWMSAGGQRFNYANASQLPPEVNAAQRIEDKITPTGQETRTFENISLPESKAKIATERSQQAKNYADATKTKADATGGFSSVKTGEGSLEGLPPNVQALVKKIANYEIDPKTLSIRGGHREQILALVSQYDPTYDQTQYGGRSAMRKDASTGKVAQNIRSLNTVVSHLATLQDASTGLGNTAYPGYNRAVNTIGSMLGNTKKQAGLKKFSVAANGVESELATVFKNTGATDQEIKAWRANFDSADSPEATKAAINQAIELLSGRLKAVSDQYNNAMGKPGQMRILTPKSRKILREKLGINPDDIESAAPVDAGGARPQDDPLGIY